MITPEPLHAGDCIGIISTARKISKQELQPAIDQLTEWAFEVKTSAHLFEQQNQFAGTDAQRLEDLQTFIDNPEIKAILCARGGYGTVRIIDQVNFLPLIENPKWICGYSDVTVIHNKLSKLGIESLHCSMPVNFSSNTTAALNSLRQALGGEPLQYEIPSHPFNQMGTAEGPITGGNLSMLYSQTGSETALETQGKILFLEDLDEYLYHIDRMMQSLKRNGYFEKAAGVIIGGMTDMNDNTVPFGKTAEEIVHEYFSEYDYPVAFGFPAGHLDDNRALILGRKAVLEVGDTVKLHYDG